MAIYHLTATVISRARGQSVVAAAAYRSGGTLRDERYGTLHNYAGKGGIAHAEILSPAGAPEWVYDRQLLWNRVEAGERRRDSQLARVIDVGLPIELTLEQRVELLRDYIAGEFTSKGMIADFSVRCDNPTNPHAHVLLTLRTVTDVGFGPKERRWNGKANLLEWRSAWADQVNLHLARAGHAVRIDHRSLEAQQIELTPGCNVGVAHTRRDARPLPRHLDERIARQRRITRENGATMIEDPTVVLRALTHQKPTFTQQDLAEFLRCRTEAAQYDAALLAVSQSSDLVALGRDADARPRFTSRDMVDAAKSLLQRVTSMASRRGHGIAADWVDSVAMPRALTPRLRSVVEYLVGEGDLKAIAASPVDKGLVLAAARLAWESRGLTIVGAARSRAAAEQLATTSGILSKILESCEASWQHGSDPLTRLHVMLVDGAEMLGLKQLERIVGVADKGRAKLVLVADAARLYAMKAAPPVRDVLLAIGLRP